jgi:hypothetical protein
LLERFTRDESRWLSERFADALGDELVGRADAWSEKRGED